MTAKLLYALLSSSIVAGTAWTASNVVMDRLPKGKARKVAERFVLAPGQMLMDKLEDRKDFRKLRKKGKKQLKKSRKKIEKAAELLQDSLNIKEVAEFDRLTRLYNVGAWAIAGFALCLLMTMVMGVSSLKSALALGAKVTLAMIFLQGALVFGGVLIYQSLGV